jgi:ATP-binding cassette subfamily C protein/ATP-binding cassette subfamily C protein LapB
MSAASNLGWGRGDAVTELTEAQAVEGVLGGFRAVTDLAACVLPLLQALNWDGDLVHVAESLPHFADQLDLTDLLNVMANMGYASKSERLRPSRMDPRLLPCLYLPEGEYAMAMVLVRAEADHWVAFDAAARSYVTIAPPAAPGTIYLFRPLGEDERAETEDAPKNFVGHVLHRFKPLFAQMLFASLVSNLLVLATPLFIMSIYDKYLPTGSWLILGSLLGGVVVAVLGDFAIRDIRARMIAYIGARLDHLLGLAIFRRLMLLAPAYTELANPNAQIARLRDFELVREFFTGPLATTLAELPFVIVFLVVMGIMAGPLVAVPAGALVIFLLVAHFARPMVERRVVAATRASSRRQEFLVEALSKPRAIKESGGEQVWRERYRHLSAQAGLKSHESARALAIVSSISQAIVVLTGLMTLAWGVSRVLDGALTVGGLMASMIMVWWVLRPLQTAFTLFSQIERVQASVAQINRLMHVKPERVGAPAVQAQPRFTGRLNFNNVSLRYHPDADPAVLGVSFQAEPGEIIALVGPNGCGKSTVLKLMLGLYRPQTGAVTLDNIDIRQLDPIELRRAIAYVPQQPEMFFGTIAQNLRLVRPVATDEELRWACEEAGVLTEIEGLERGFDTRLGDGRTDRVSASLRQRLSLARAYLKRAPVTLLDEPASGLDFMADRHFMVTLERMRSHTTVVLVTHRPSHLKLADKIVVMQQGQVRMAGPAKQVLDRLPAGFF